MNNLACMVEAHGEQAVFLSQLAKTPCRRSSLSAGTLSMPSWVLISFSKNVSLIFVGSSRLCSATGIPKNAQANVAGVEHCGTLDSSLHQEE